MKKTLLLLIVFASLFMMTAGLAEADDISCAVYLGVKDYGSSEVNRDTKENFEYLFFVDGETRTYLIDNGDPDHDSTWTYEIQNHLKEGYLYRISVTDGTVVKAEEIESDDPVLVSGVIGKIGKKSIAIDTKVYKMVSDVKTWRIAWRAGQSKVEEDLPTPGKTVRAFLNKDGQITAMFLTPISVSVVYPVKCQPGKKTLKNFLATAFQPVGTTLYMFGGGWNWQDTGSGDLVTQIGVPQSWIDFFQAQTMFYTFKSLDYADGDDPANMDPPNSYYPYYGFNEYNYAGVDCSAYIAWVIYNTVNKKSGEEGYLTNSKNFALSLVNRKWGTLTNKIKKPKNRKSSKFLPGDIFSINGHVWICLGTMTDGSIVILHSTPSLSYTNFPGGGPQIGAIGESTDCEAWQIADLYMKKYYPVWSRRYPTTLKDFESMTDVTEEGTGKFSWDLSGKGVLKDPDDYRKKTVEEILADLFEEN